MNHTQVSAGTDKTLALMREVFRGISEQQDEALLHTELSMAQIKALLAISKDGDPSVGGVAKELKIGLSAASQIVERLVKAGLVERRAHPSDRRVIQCVLTPQGQVVVERFQTGPRLLRQWLKHMDPNGLTQLQQGLTALVQVIRENRIEGEG